MIYAIGDIHGHLDKLKSCHELIVEDAKAAGAGRPRVVHIGDLVDRGPDSRGVIQYLSDGVARGEDWIVLCGNHDRLFLDTLDGGDGTHPRVRAGVAWPSQALGGKATLDSYGVKRKMLEGEAALLKRLRRVVPEAHVDFLRTMPLWYRKEGKIFVHAGIRPGFPLEAQEPDDLMWIRDEFLWHLGDHEALIVHGHTPVDEPTHYGNRVNIDTGAGWGHELIPVVFDGPDVFALRREGRQKLKVPRSPIVKPRQA